MTAVEPGLAENICCISYFVSLVPYHVGGDWILVKMIFYHFLLEIWKSSCILILNVPALFTLVFHFLLGFPFYCIVFNIDIIYKLFINIRTVKKYK